MKLYCAILFIWAVFCTAVFAHPPDGVIDSLKQLIFPALKNPNIRPDTTTIRRLNNLAYKFFDSSPDSTFYYGKLEIDLATRINDQRGIADGSVQVAAVNSFQGNYRQSTRLYNAALGIYKQLNYQHGLYNCYTGLGANYDYLGDYDEAIKLYQKALQISIKSNNEADAAECYNLLGITYDNKGDYSQSLDNYFKSLAINIKQKDELSAADKYCNIGIIMHELELNTKALDYYIKARDIWRKLEDKQGLATIAQNIAEVLLDQEKYAEALAGLRYAEAHYRAMKDFDGLSLIYDDLGLFKLRTGEKDSAIYYYKQSLQFAEKNNIRYNKAIAYVGLAQAYNNNSEFGKAYQFTLKGQLTADTLGSMAVKAEAMKQASVALVGMKRFEEAYHQMLEYSALRSKQKHNESIHKIALHNIEIEFAKEQKDKAEMLRRHDKELQQELAMQKKIDIAYGAIIVVFATLAYIYYRGRRRQKAINAVLNDKNREIILQQEDINLQSIKLNDLNLLKDRLIGVLAHDLRAPISTLRGLFNLMIDKSITHQEFVEMAPMVFNKLEHTSDFLNTLLFWINSQVDAVGSNVKAFKIADIISKELTHLDDKIKQKDINVIVNVLPNITAVADPSSIRIVVHNILTNAIKFSERGGVIEIAAFTENGRTVLYIKDNGVGISAKQMESLFKSRVNSLPGTENETGTGMGLLFCKDLVEKYDGKIWVESTEGEGSKFCFELPA